VQIWSAIGREFTLATNLVDFAQPRSFKLSFNNKDNEPEIPLIIHRAPLGTHERFIGFLIEHYAGKFPLWLAPLQVKILPISDKFMDYAVEVRNELRANGIRVEIDDRSEKIGRKIRDTELAKVPYMFVIGEKEMNEGAVSLRIQGKGDQGSVNVKELVAQMKLDILNRVS
jgi:threonyl-tRNA synthetase